MKRKWTEVRIFFFMTAWVKTSHYTSVMQERAIIHDISKMKIMKKNAVL